MCLFVHRLARPHGCICYLCYVMVHDVSASLFLRFSHIEDIWHSIGYTISDKETRARGGVFFSILVNLENART